MPYQVTDQDLQTYHTQGYVIFRGILPPSLIADLRKQADKAREIARRISGPSGSSP